MKGQIQEPLQVINISECTFHGLKIFISEHQLNGCMKPRLAPHIIPPLNITHKLYMFSFKTYNFNMDRLLDAQEENLSNQLITC